MVVMMALNRPVVTRAQTYSNVDGVSPTVETSAKLTPGLASTATPPWFDKSGLAVGARGRGRSTTLQPVRRRRENATLSSSCHVSVRHWTSIRQSRRTSSRSLIFPPTDRMFRSPNCSGFFNDELTRDCGRSCCTGCWGNRRRQRPARTPRRGTIQRPNRRPGYGTCSQGISQFYLHTHTFIRNRKEPYLPLPFQP